MNTRSKQVSIFTAVLFVTVCLIPSATIAQNRSRKGKVRCPAVIVEKSTRQIRKRREYNCFKGIKAAEKQGFSTESAPITPVSGLWSVAASRASSDCPVEPDAIIGDTLPVREDGATILMSATPDIPAPFSGVRTARDVFLSRPSIAECSIEVQTNSENGLAALGSYFGRSSSQTAADQISEQGTRIETMVFKVQDETSANFEYRLKLNCPQYSCSIFYSGSAVFLTEFPRPE